MWTLGTFFDFHKVIEPLINPPSADLPASVLLGIQPNSIFLIT